MSARQWSARCDVHHSGTHYHWLGLDDAFICIAESKKDEAMKLIGGLERVLDRREKHKLRGHHQFGREPARSTTRLARVPRCASWLGRSGVTGPHEACDQLQNRAVAAGCAQQINFLFWACARAARVIAGFCTLSHEYHTWATLGDLGHGLRAELRAEKKSARISVPGARQLAFLCRRARTSSRQSGNHARWYSIALLKRSGTASEAASGLLP